MKYYYKEHISGYQRMLSLGMKSWGELHGRSDDFVNFSSRNFLEEILPSLKFDTIHPSVLEYGTGTGPVACYLSEQGFEVEAVDLIPSAIELAKTLAKERCQNINFRVLDICDLPHTGKQYDLIVDSYCLQGIVTDEDRRKVFSAIKARLNTAGYYMISTAMYVKHRDFPNEIITDSITGKKFNAYGPGGIYDAETEIYFDPFSADRELNDNPENYDTTIKVNDEWYIPRRRYRKPESLTFELEQHGFRVVHQSGQEGENIVCVHQIK